MINERLGRVLFLILFALLYFSTNTPFVLAESGVDPSWWASLVMAINNGETFGKDFIFNYGPLGYFNTLLLPQGVSPWVSFVLHLFTLANFLFIINSFFQKYAKSWIWVGVISVAILLPWGFIADATFTLFYFLLFWLLYIKSTKNSLPIIFCLTLAALIFFIKVNLSIISYGVLVFSLVYFGITKIISWKTILLSVVLLVGFTFGLASSLHVDLLPYLSSSLEIISAYQDAMAVKLVDGWELWVMLSFFFAIVAIVLSLVFVFNIARFWSNLYLYLLVAMACFLGFKQAVTATGHYNIFGLFLLMPPLVALLILFLEHNLKGLPSKVFVSVLVLQFIATQFIRVSYTGYDLKSYVYFAFPDAVVGEYNANPKAYQFFKLIKYKNPLIYFQKVFTYQYEDNFAPERINPDVVLPKHVLDKIGNKTVDVFPWETSIVFFNKLKYSHRPIMQSYQANSGWLTQKNEDFLCSKNAPDFIIAQLANFRSQNPSWVDQGGYLSIAKNYHLVDTIYAAKDTSYLFERNEKVLVFTKKPGETKKSKIGAEIKIPSNNGLMNLKAEVKYSLKGKLARLFFQPPYLMAEVTYTDGSKSNFRVPPPILKGGILTSVKLENEADFVRFHSKIDQPRVAISTIKFYPINNWGFEENFEYQFENIE